ncbi:MAG: hypothetical protein NTX04_13995 [Verrucomicrobia bacterium]|nr:hypothetical protein [Verrucomicrobiota bacterium]
MSTTLFSEIQKLFERTYAQVGVNLEDCLIDSQRSRQLSRAAGAAARELSELARTFLRKSHGQLHIGIYYSRWLIDQLERHDPRKGLCDANILSLIAFVEEINHALHAALQFQRGVDQIAHEDYARNLELQATVDTYLVLLLFVGFFRKTQKVSAVDRRWLRFHLFARQDPHAYSDHNLRGRYLETGALAERYTRFLDALNGARRIDEIRHFHALDYPAKQRHILALMDTPTPPPTET